MSRPTPISRASSLTSGASLILAPETSVLLLSYWCAVHLAALGGVAWLDAPLAVRAAGAALLVLHAVVRRPRRPPVLCRHTDGRWSVAGQTPGGLRLDPATVFGRRWARLVFRVEGAHRRARLAVLLLRDQVPAEAWRALQAELRRSSAARPERPPDFS